MSSFLGYVIFIFFTDDVYNIWLSIGKFGYFSFDALINISLIKRDFTIPVNVKLHVVKKWWKWFPVNYFSMNMNSAK